MQHPANVLEHVDPPVTESEATRLVLEVYGVKGKAVGLSGERDQNFCIECSDGSRFVLKISNSAEDPAVSDLQTQILLHLAANPSIVPVPELKRTLDGAPQFVWCREGARHIVRLISYLDGVPLHETTAAKPMLFAVGRAMAALDRALENFIHAAQDHELLWDLQRAHELAPRLDEVPEGKERDLARAGLERFSEFALPVFPTLSAQVIHNDLNPYNVFVDPDALRVTGVLDFGDALRAPRIVEIAIAAAYHLRPGPDAFDHVIALVSGYNREAPLLREELSILCPLMAGRLAMSVTIAFWRSSLYPENRDYIRKNLAAALRGLEVLLDADAFSAKGWPLQQIAENLEGAMPGDRCGSQTHSG